MGEDTVDSPEDHILAVAVYTEQPVHMSVSSHLAVQRNAFSTAQAAAKVCDGATSASIAERIACVQVVTSTKGATAFALLPSITGHTWTYSAASTTAQTTSQNAALPVAATQESLPPTIHAFTGYRVESITVPAGGTVAGTGYVNNDLKETTLIGDTTVATGKKVAQLVKNKDAPDEYRLVSAAMRLSCINAADQMQGWFEAVRVRPSWSTEGLRLFSQGTGPSEVVALGPTSGLWEEGIIGSPNWSNDPSYVTGRLRDLGRHTFYLQPTKPRKFHRWPSQVNADAYDDLEEQACGFDPCFDVVLVRIFSQENTAATLSQAIHCHTVKNWETMYDSNKPMARFHTSTIPAKKAVEYADKQMTRDSKASMIRNASSYGYRY